MKLSFASLSAALAAAAIASPVVVDRDSVGISSATLNNFKYFAQWGGASYCNSDDAVGQTVSCTEGTCPDVEANGGTILTTFKGAVTGISGLVGIDHVKSSIVVSIRGSANVRNYIADIVFAQTGCTDLVADCSAHAGFKQAWTEISDAAAAGLQTARASFPSYAIVFAGHSLGGAVATLGAAYLRKSTGAAIALYTFGSPRVGNEAFAAFVTSQQSSGGNSGFRVTHFDDPVPRLAPIAFGYRHTSPEYWLSAGPANATVYAAADVKVCDGFANTACNAGQSGLDVDAHKFYLVPISACNPDGLQFKERRSSGVEGLSLSARESRRSKRQGGAELSDEELEERLNALAKIDQQYAAAMSAN